MLNGYCLGHCKNSTEDLIHEYLGLDPHVHGIGHSANEERGKAGS
jgi:hypothetical protein